MIADRNSPIEKKARLFWMARQRATELIGDGHFDRAHEVIAYLLVSGEWLLGGSGAERVLGAAMRKSAGELSARTAQ